MKDPMGPKCDLKLITVKGYTNMLGLKAIKAQYTKVKTL